MIEISWPLLLTQVVTFLAALFVVWKFFWGPLTKVMRDRSQKIAEDIQRAETGRREVEALEADYRRRLAEIEERARQEIEQALHQGQQAKAEILKEARTEAERVLEKARQDLLIAREQVIRELRQQVAEVSLMALERVLNQGLDAKLKQKLTDQFLLDTQLVEKIK